MNHDEHRRKAESNLQAYRALSQLDPPHHEWRITILYYAAVHLVDAYLATRNRHPDSHVERKHDMRRLDELYPIYDLYRTVENASRDARYENVTFTPQDVDDVERRLEQLDDHVGGLLGVATPVRR